MQQNRNIPFPASCLTYWDAFCLLQNANFLVLVAWSRCSMSKPQTFLYSVSYKEIPTSIFFQFILNWSTYHLNVQLSSMKSTCYIVKNKPCLNTSDKQFLSQKMDTDLAEGWRLSCQHSLHASRPVKWHWLQGGSSAAPLPQRQPAGPGVFSLQGRRIRRHLTAAFQCSRGCRKTGEGLLTLRVQWQGTGNGFKLT